VKLIKDVLDAEKSSEEMVCKTKEKAQKDFNLSKERFIDEFNSKIDMAIAKNSEALQELNLKLDKKFTKEEVKYNKRIDNYNKISDKDISRMADKSLSLILKSDLK